MPAYIFTAKVVGTMSVGLWAGYNLSLIHHPKDAFNFGVSSWISFMRNAPVNQDRIQRLWIRIKELLIKAFHTTGAVVETAVKREDQKTEIETASLYSPFNVSKLHELSSKALCISALSGVSFASHMTAFSLSSTSGKHPYLLYLALGAPLVGALQYFGAQKLRNQAIHQASVDRISHLTQAKDEYSEEDTDLSSDLSSSTYEHVRPHSSTSSSPVEVSTSENANLNANSAFILEHKYSIFSTVVASLSSFLYLISVIGLAGDARF